MSKFNKDALIEEANKIFKKKKQKEEGIQILTEEPKQEPIRENTPAPMQEEGPQKGLGSQVKELNEKLDLLMPKIKEEKLKPFKLPWNIRSKLKNLHKSNSVMVLLLRTDRTVQPMVAKIENGLIYVNEKWHNCATDFIYLWLGKSPMIVLPEWDLNPIGTKDYYDAIKEGRNVEAQTVIIRAIEQAQIEEKKKLSGMMWIWIIIGAIIVGYVLFAGQ